MKTKNKELKKVLALILFMITLALLSFSPSQQTRLYEVRVGTRIGNCTTPQTFTVEARSQQEARSKATRAARAQLQISIRGISQL